MVQVGVGSDMENGWEEEDVETTSELPLTTPTFSVIMFRRHVGFPKPDVCKSSSVSSCSLSFATGSVGVTEEFSIGSADEMNGPSRAIEHSQFG